MLVKEWKINEEIKTTEKKNEKSDKNQSEVHQAWMFPIG